MDIDVDHISMIEGQHIAYEACRKNPMSEATSSTDVRTSRLCGLLRLHLQQRHTLYHVWSMNSTTTPLDDPGSPEKFEKMAMPSTVSPTSQSSAPGLLSGFQASSRACGVWGSGFRLVIKFTFLIGYSLASSTPATCAVAPASSSAFSMAAGAGLGLFWDAWSGVELCFDVLHAGDVDMWRSTMVAWTTSIPWAKCIMEGIEGWW